VLGIRIDCRNRLVGFIDFLIYKTPKKSVGGRRSGPGKPFLLTQGWWKRSWFLVSRSVKVELGAGRDRERQRSGRSALPRPITPGQGGAHGMRSLLLPEKGEPCERAWPKLEERRQTHLPPGVWIAARWSGVVVRQASGDSPGRAVRRRSAWRKPQGSGVERFLGGRYVGRFADVGARCLPGAAKVSREASQGGVG